MAGRYKQAMRTLAAPVLLALSAVAALTAGAARAQDSARGAALYRALPGQPALGSCISCHGEPINNRNSILRGAAGPELISKTIAAVSAMGFLRQYLSDSDLADISAYLATIVPAGPLESLPDLWPTTDDFGAQLVGTQSAPRTVLIRNLQPREAIAVGTVRSADPVAFPLQHDCPISLPPLGQCRISAWFRPQAAGPAGAVFAVLDSSGRTLREGALTGAGAPELPATLAWSAGTPELIDFAQVPLGQSMQRTLGLVNPSSIPVGLTRLRVTGPNASRFTLQAPCVAAGRLEPGASCAVTLGFAPSAAGRVEGWIDLVSDAGNAPLVRIAAAGVAAPAQPPSSPASMPAGESSSGGGAVSAGWLVLLLAAVAALRRKRGR